MLGRLRMSIKDSEEAFRHLSERVFAPSWTKPAVFRGVNALVGSPWFKAEVLEKAVKDLLNERRLSNDESMKESSDPACKV